MKKVVHQSSVPEETVNMKDASGVKIQWLINSSDDAENFFMRRFTVDVGGYTPRHSHPYEHEVYVLEGKGKVFIDGEWHDFEKDFVIFVPPDLEHQFKNTGDTELIFLCSIPAKPSA